MKSMKYAVLVLAVGLTGCGGAADSAGQEGTEVARTASADAMAGCYATKKEGKADIRIEEEAGAHYVSFLRQGAWKKEPKPLAFASSVQLQDMFKSEANQIEAALVYPNGAFGLFKLVEGSMLKRRDPDSDYMALVVFGAGPVYRSACK